jgi:hypothetical protein
LGDALTATELPRPKQSVSDPNCFEPKHLPAGLSVGKA